jgi:cell division protein FtsI/penicillin-binding protein 2
VSPGTYFRLTPTIKVADRVIHEAHARPTQDLTVRGIVERSSNVGTITIAQRIGEGRLAYWIDRFGFGNGRKRYAFAECAAGHRDPVYSGKVRMRSHKTEKRGSGVSFV